MNKPFRILALLTLSFTLLISCNEDENNDPTTPTDGNTTNEENTTDEDDDTEPNTTATFNDEEYLIDNDYNLTISPDSDDTSWILEGKLANGSDTLEVSITLYQLETGTFTTDQEAIVNIELGEGIYSTYAEFNAINEELTSISAEITTATEDEISGSITATLVGNGFFQGSDETSELEMIFTAKK